LLGRHANREVRLNYQVDQKDAAVLLLLKGFLGGNIGYHAPQDAYHYRSTSFGSARNVINYFDRFHLLSTKHTSYLRWRKAYALIHRREHLSAPGWDKIVKLKETMDRLAHAPQFKIES